MDNTKPFLASKTVWSALGTIATGIYLCYTGNIPEGIMGISGGFGLLFARTSKKQIK